MFHPEPQRFFTGAYLKIGYFETNVDLRYQDEVAGDLIWQVNQALEVLETQHLRAWISYEGLQRIETDRRSLNSGTQISIGTSRASPCPHSWLKILL